ncbi:MAG: FAD-binding dehydrogenase [Gammaproteobacteria bacterium HGW-Gammaproteobacteria-12]|nr:MAG: FAD-binding dehydrogenase [Gammaproteobacteria bacterium HGW-Gammaproteobacteria-12]
MRNQVPINNKCGDLPWPTPHSTATCWCAAHLGKRVILVEKDAVLGGATAWSGGWLWAPRNPLARRAGIIEDIEQPRTYLRNELGEHYRSELVDAFLQHCPDMVAFFEQYTALQFVDGNGIPDMHGDTPGAASGGHQVIAAPYDGREVLDLLPRLRKTMRETSFMGMPIMAGADLAAFLNMTRSPGALLHVIRRFTTHLYHLARYGRAMHLVNGVALVARLARSAQDLGVQMMVSTPAQRLIIEDGPVAWAPVSKVPHADGSVGHFPHIIDRGKPGIIGVLQNGKRFVNEAGGYYDYVDAMLEAIPEDQQACSWLICDHLFQRRYGLGFARPAPVPLWPHIRNGYLKRGHSLEALAQACGIDPFGLVATVDEFNQHARRGEDPLFGRGSTAFNRRSGDAQHSGPNPCVAPIEHGPFYAVKVQPGCFGTFAGLRTDGHARVLDGAGQPIPGLYAAGTDMASPMGGHYPSGGINIGPALTFGYIAGRHAATV